MADRDSGTFNQKSNTTADYCSGILNALKEIGVDDADIPYVMQQVLPPALRKFGASRTGALSRETWQNVSLTNAGIVTPAGHGGAL